MVRSSLREIGSTPTPGSSSNSKRGLPNNAQASPSFCFMPPESLPAKRPVKRCNAVNSNNLAKASARSAPVTLRRSACKVRFSSTERSSYKPNFCGMYPIAR